MLEEDPNASQDSGEDRWRVPISFSSSTQPRNRAPSLRSASVPNFTEQETSPPRMTR